MCFLLTTDDDEHRPRVDLIVDAENVLPEDPDGEPIDG
jgi:hypothetical protein